MSWISHIAKDVELTVSCIHQLSVLVYNTNRLWKIRTRKIALFSLDEQTLKIWPGFWSPVFFLPAS